MPDFIGRSLAGTITEIQDAGMEIGRVSYRDYPGIKAGTVVDQTPPLGTGVSRADDISLTVVQKRIEEDRGTVSYKLLSFYIPEGLRNRRVRVVAETERSSSEIMDEERPPGDRVQLLVEVEGETSIYIYIDGDLKDIRYF